MDKILYDAAFAGCRVLSGGHGKRSTLYYIYFFILSSGLIFNGAFYNTAPQRGDIFFTLAVASGRRNLLNGPVGFSSSGAGTHAAANTQVSGLQQQGGLGGGLWWGIRTDGVGGEEECGKVEAGFLGWDWGAWGGE